MRSMSGLEYSKRQIYSPLSGCTAQLPLLCWIFLVDLRTPLPLYDPGPKAERAQIMMLLPPYYTAGMIFLPSINAEFESPIIQLWLHHSTKAVYVKVDV